VRVSLALLIVVFAAACTVDVPDPDTASFACDSDDDCADDHVCSAYGQGTGVCVPTLNCGSDAECGPLGVCTVASNNQGVCHVGCARVTCGNQAACIFVKGRQGNVQACKPCTGCNNGCAATNASVVDYYDGTGLSCIGTTSGCTSNNDCAGGVCVLVANGTKRECRPACDMAGGNGCETKAACAMVQVAGGTSTACLTCSADCGSQVGERCTWQGTTPVFGDDTSKLACDCNADECMLDMGNQATCQSGSCTVSSTCNNDNECGVGSGKVCVLPNAGASMGVCVGACSSDASCPNGACAYVYGTTDTTPTRRVCKATCDGSCDAASGQGCNLGSYYGDTPSCGCDEELCVAIGGTCNANVCYVPSDTTPPNVSASFYPTGTQVTVTLSCTDPDNSLPCSYRCAVDPDNINDTAAYTSCSNNQVLHLPKSGLHYFAVVATDSVGNVATPRQFNFNMPGTTWKALAVGPAHSCAIGGDKSLWCWGDNYFDQILGGTYNEVPDILGNPLWVGPADDWASVSAGMTRTCGIREATPGVSYGTLWCWGYNNVTYDLLPTQIGASAQWAKVAVGQYHACAVDVNHNLYCWGDNNMGAVGVGSGAPGNIFPPVQISDPGPVSQLALGNQFTCALNYSGDLYCWGANGVGQVGTGSAGNNIYTPSVVARVPASATWQSVAVGEEHACAISYDGTTYSTYCWGGSKYGEAGAGTPTLTFARNGDTTVVAGGYHTCGGTNNAYMCWGRNSHYELMREKARIDPMDAVALPAADAGWLTVGFGAHHACGLSTNGKVFCWGSRDLGQLGEGVGRHPVVPISDISIGAPAVKLVAGANHACVLDASAGTSGFAQCWGSDAQGQLGNERPDPDGGQPYPWSYYMSLMSPTYVYNGTGSWRMLATGASHTCAIQDNADLWCWGANASGQLALAEAGYWQRAVPAWISTDDWNEVAAGDAHTCGIKADGSLYCWGNNELGQLGINSTGGGGAAMTRVGTLYSWLGLSSRRNHTCARQGQYSYCWGDNNKGQIGKGDMGVPQTTPYRINSPLFAQVSAGGQHTCGIANSGSLYCWGANGSGQLGVAEGDTTDRVVITQVLAANATWSALATGDAHTCGIRNDGTNAGTLWCWGSGFDGQLGVPFAPYRQTVPMQVGSDTDWLGIAAGANFTCGLKSGGSVRCWGDNLDGQLGDSGAWTPAFASTLD